MGWSLLIAVAFVLGLSVFATASRRAELGQMARRLAARDAARALGADRAQLQQPEIDLSRCLGCGKCVQACPEDGVLALVHGQAAVVNGARCVGVAECARSCPVDAIAVRLTDLTHRDDVPALTAELESQTAPGVFLAGEVTAHALIKTAVEHGVAVADAAAARLRASEPRPQGDLDLCVVGAGPAGIACALRAKQLGLTCVVLDQAAALGGTVAQYPRAKLVLTQPVTLPLHGPLAARSYQKEDLIELWQRLVAEHRLEVRCGVRVDAVEPDPRGGHRVSTDRGALRSRLVCLAVGRRGTPRRLGVAGEDLTKVQYGLLDASSYRGQRVLVVGGGDSAAEAAVALAEQDGTTVHLAYRKPRFFRLRAAVEQRLLERVEAGRIELLLRSEVRAIAPGHTEVDVLADPDDPTAPHGVLRLRNDAVFVLAGGTAPVELLARSGVSCDPELRVPAGAGETASGGNGLRRAAWAFGALLAITVGWAFAHGDYYGLALDQRPLHAKHGWLRPGAGFGLATGIGALLLVVANLLYLLRRAERAGLRWGSLRAWMACHEVTGVLCLALAVVHAAMAPRDTPGGHALWALAILVGTGAIGRYFYAYVPRAANGRELALAEIKAQLAALGRAADQARDGNSDRGFGAVLQRTIEQSIEQQRWHPGFWSRAVGLWRSQRGLHRAIGRLLREGRRRGVASSELSTTARLLRRAHRTALMTAHFEDLRAVLATWRYLHRWVAALMVLLVLVHIATALFYGNVLPAGAAGQGR